MRKTLVATLATLTAVTLTACGGGAATSAAPGGSAPAGGEKVKLGIAIPAGNETFWTSWIKGAQAEAEKLNVDLTITDAKNDAQTMNDQVNTIIVGGIKGLAVASVDPTGNKGTAQAATDANIPMITSNRTLEMAYGGVGAANPQVHAADDRSLMQNVQAIPDVVDATRRLYGDVAVALSPVDLIGADGPFPGGPAEPGGPPSNEDPRQRSAFAGAWAVAALAHMARCRTTSTTLFELAGPRGLIDDGGDLFPVAQVLRVLAPHYGSSVRGVEVDDPDRLAVLALGSADGPVLAANLTSGTLAAVLPGGQRVDFEAYDVLLVTADSVTPLAGHRTES